MRVEWAYLLQLHDVYIARNTIRIGHCQWLYILVNIYFATRISLPTRPAYHSLVACVVPKIGNRSTILLQGTNEWRRSSSLDFKSKAIITKLNLVREVRSYTSDLQLECMRLKKNNLKSREKMQVDLFPTGLSLCQAVIVALWRPFAQVCELRSSTECRQQQTQVTRGCKSFLFCSHCF